MVSVKRTVPSEAAVLTMLDHENIVKCLELFQDEDDFYLIMEHHGDTWSSPVQSPAAGSPQPCNLTPPMTPASSSSASSVVLNSQYGSPEPGDVPTTPGYKPLNDVTEESGLRSPFIRSAPSPVNLSKSSCDLFECIEQLKRFPEPKARYIFKQVAAAVFHMDQQGICHRRFLGELTKS